MENFLQIAMTGVLGLVSLSSMNALADRVDDNGIASLPLGKREVVLPREGLVWAFETVTCRTRFLDIRFFKKDGIALSPSAVLPAAVTKEFIVPSFVSYVLVDDNGDGADFNNISDALTATDDGDYIYVCPGTYNERIKVSNHVNLIGLDGADTTIIDASGTGDGTVVSIAGSALLRGFTVTGARADEFCFYGGGIHVSGDYGDGHNYPVIEQNKIVDNQACKVGGIYLSGYGNSDGTTTYNTAIVRNNIIARNDANTSNAGGIMVKVDMNVNSEIYNNVISNNTTATSIGGVEITAGGYATDLRNNIIHGNSGNAIRDYSALAVIEYNNSYGNGSDYSGGTGNLNEDPLFVDTADFELNAASTLVDAGDPDSAYDDIDGTRNDMGAYGGSHGDW